MEKNRFETTHTYKTSMDKKIILMAALAMATVCTRAQVRPVKVFEARMYGIKPDTRKNTSPLMAKFIQKVKDSVAEGDSVRRGRCSRRLGQWPGRTSNACLVIGSSFNCGSRLFPAGVISQPCLRTTVTGIRIIRIRRG